MAKKQQRQKSSKKPVDGGNKKEAQQGFQPTKPKTQGQKSRLLSKIYRQFSRRKYNKYKLQFPRIRESELINKIIKEWEAMGEKQRLNLEKIYIETGGSEFLKDSSSNSKSKSKSKSKSDSDIQAKGKGKGKGKYGDQDSEKKKETEKNPDKHTQKQKKQQEEIGKEQEEKQGKPKKKKKPSPKVRVFVEKAVNKSQFKDDSDLSKSVTGQRKKQEQESDSADIAIRGPKKIRKVVASSAVESQKKPKNDYLQFFKYYHNRLAAEHPRWSNGQISSIIRLLWRKRQTSKREKSKALSINKLIKKPLSGRVMYRKQKQASGFTRDQIKIMWKQLPHESKKFWEKRGRGGVTVIHKMPNKAMDDLKTIMRKGVQNAVISVPASTNSLNWMNTKIS